VTITNLSKGRWQILVKSEGKWTCFLQVHVRVRADIFEIEPPDETEGVLMVKLKKKQIGVGGVLRIPEDSVPDKW